jgi:hypothetical protein
VTALLRAVTEVFEDFSYLQEFEREGGAALIFRARVGDKQLQGLDLIEYDDEGKVSKLTVMVRPMSGMLALAEAMRAKLEAAAS